MSAKAPAVTREVCGTSAGYYQHRIHGEERCDDCRAAATADGRAQRDRRLAAASDLRVQALIIQASSTDTPCTVDPETWFADNRAVVAEAKAVCATCPVATPCLDVALANRERFGVWAGTTPEERDRLIRRQQRQALAS